MTAGPQAYKSKTFATWIAVLAGSLGLHRFYLHGFRDRWGWLFVWPTLVGLYGVQRMRHLFEPLDRSWSGSREVIVVDLVDATLLHGRRFAQRFGDVGVC